MTRASASKRARTPDPPKGRPEHFYRHVSPEGQLDRSKYVAHTSFTEGLLDTLAEVLVELEALRSTFNAEQRASGLLFPTPAGKHHYRTLLHKPFLDICKHAGIEKRFTPHGCRRTGAKLYGRTVGTRVAMDIAGHLTEERHRHYTPLDAAEKNEAGRQAFAGLRLIAGGSKSQTVTQTVTPGRLGGKASSK